MMMIRRAHLFRRWTSPLTAWVVCACAMMNVSSAEADDWRQFRGPSGSSVAKNAELPIEFGPEKNVTWKVELPGKGVSGPIVVGNRVFLTASSGSVLQNRLHVVCLDAATGKQLWQRQFWATGRCFHHPTSANAAPTPASDGERIFAFYSSGDLVCLDLDGNLLWYRGLGADHPKAGNDFGMASSPVVVAGTVVVQMEGQGDSFAAGLDVETGETRWEVPRHREGSWSSPSVLHPDSDPLVLMLSTNGLTAYEPRSGEKRWTFEAPAAGIPSATPHGDRVYLPARGLTVIQVPRGASEPVLLWDAHRLAPGNASPVINDGRVYILPRAGLLNCGDAETGEVLWQTRLSGTYWATPVVVGEHLYCPNQDGQVHVVRVSDEKGLIAATNELNDRFLASPAVAGDAMYLRGEKHLWKIAKDE